MGVFEKLFGNKKATQKINGYFQMLDGYTPSFSTLDGGAYEMELTRACIHTFASHCSKLQPVVEGADYNGLQKMLDTKPNPFMTSAQFLYKVATIYETKNTCFIVPLIDKFDRTIGFYPVNPQRVDIVDVKGEPFVRFVFSNGKNQSFELSRVGVVSKFLYKNDVVGENNRALNTTLQLIQMQNQGIEEGIKNSASFRFMANVNNFSKAEDLAKERKKFVEENFGSNSGGLALFPNTYTNVQQINSTAKVVDTEQMNVIQNRVYQYFGINEDILMNKVTGDSWSAYYEGKVEPFLIQLSQAMTSMYFTSAQISRGDAIVWTSNRMQYMTTSDKANVTQMLFDRGIITLNQAMDIWQLPHIENGDVRYIRKEYIDVADTINTTDEVNEDDTDGQNEDEGWSGNPNDGTSASEE